MTALPEYIWTAALPGSVGLLLSAPWSVRLPRAVVLTASAAGLAAMCVPLFSVTDPTVRCAVLTAVLAGVGYLLTAADWTAADELPQRCGMMLQAVVGAVMAGTSGSLPVVHVGLGLLVLSWHLLVWRSATASMRRAVRDSLLFQSVCLLLVFLGLVLVFGVHGRATFEGSAAGSSIAVPPQFTIPPDAAVVACVVLLCGLCGLIVGPWIRFAGGRLIDAADRPAVVLLSLQAATPVVLLMQVLPPMLAPWTRASEAALLAASALLLLAGSLIVLRSASLRGTSLGVLVALSGLWLIGVAVACFEAQLDLQPAVRLDALTAGLPAVRLQMSVDVLAWLGWMIAWTRLRRGTTPLEYEADITGLLQQRPLAAVWAALCLFSLAGVPPLPGFWGRWRLVSALLRPHHTSSLTDLYDAHTGFLAAGVAIVFGSIAVATAVSRLVGTMTLASALGRIEAGSRK